MFYFATAISDNADEDEREDIIDVELFNPMKQSNGMDDQEKLTINEYEKNLEQMKNSEFSVN